MDTGPQDPLSNRTATRSRLIRREVLASLVFWLLLMPALDLILDQKHPFSVQSVLINLLMLPIFLLEGYLRGRWQWQDLVKRYPE